MKKNLLKALTSASVGIMLFSGFSVATAPVVHAVTAKTISKYARNYHRVVVTKPTWVYRVKLANPRAYNKYYKAYRLMPGDTALIQYRGVEWGWNVGKSHRYCTLTDSFSWFEPYSKYTWIDKGLLDNTLKDEHLSYRFNWKQYRKLVSLGIMSNSYTTKTWKNKVQPLIKQWHLKPVKDY